MSSPIDVIESFFQSELGTRPTGLTARDVGHPRARRVRALADFRRRRRHRVECQAASAMELAPSPGPSLVPGTSRNNGQPRTITDTDPAAHEPSSQLNRPPSYPYNDEVIGCWSGTNDGSAA
jgi:hypothetical protein